MNNCSYNRNTPEELAERIFEIETTRGITKSEHPCLEKLSSKKYLFVLLWTDPEIIILNKTQWAEENGFNRREPYVYLTERKVIEAIKYLDNCIHSGQASQMIKKIYEMGMKGDARAQKMYLERFRPVGVAPEKEEREDPTIKWDFSLANDEQVTEKPEENVDTSPDGQATH